MGYRFYRYSYNRNRATYNPPAQEHSTVTTVTNEELSDPGLVTRIENLVNETSLSAWEKDFLGSIKVFFSNRKSLTSGQYHTFRKIEKRLDPVTVKENNDWIQNYTEQMCEEIHLLAKIYKNLNSPYFRQTIEKVLNNPTVKLSKTEYEKFAKTKYAEGYLNNFRCKPRFSVGDTVCPGSKFYESHNHTKFLAAIIIDNEGQLPRTHSEGGKLYVVLPYGSTQTMTVEERELKYYRSK